MDIKNMQKFSKTPIQLEVTAKTGGTEQNYRVNLVENENMKSTVPEI